MTTLWRVLPLGRASPCKRDPEDIEYCACRGWEYNAVTGVLWIQNICPHLQSDNTCGIFEKRPRRCATYPDGDIPLPKGCSFSTECIL